jgi:2-succinyl-5-enolpyruvyl-6-hydroxy-3-cyclohexene-1-carboxylate synthase
MEGNRTENETHADGLRMHDTLKLPNVNYLHATVLLKQLISCGARRAVISPGSRSTPLALCAATLPELKTHVLIDERSAAFFALGLSKSDGVPAILICTSGTAAANYFPAVIEAAQSGVPLIMLTSDRPAALRYSGAPQTIDQTHLYGNYTRFFADLPEAQLTTKRCRAVRNLAAQAYSAAVAIPRGPVHLNVPLDEPLAPKEQEEQTCRALWNELTVEGNIRLSPPPARLADEETLKHLALVLGDSLCGLIVAGVNATRNSEDAAAIYRLSRQLGWPVFADVTSGLSGFGYPVFPHFDIFLKEEELAGLAPDVVLTFGGYPTSKTLNNYLDRHRAADTLRVHATGLPSDPTFRADEIIAADIAPLCEELGKRVRASRDSLLFEAFRQASYRISTALEKGFDDARCEALYVREAVRHLPEGANLVLASSLSVRYADAMLGGGHSLQIFALRGANGIDGTMSHAAGIAAASGKPTLLVTGDLAFFHDMNGVMAARRFAPNLSVLLLNNNGGGIFHLLPTHQYESAADFEMLHGTPHDLILSAAAALFGVEWREVHHPREIGPTFDATRGTPLIIEANTRRDANYQAYTRLISELGREAVRS